MRSRRLHNVSSVVIFISIFISPTVLSFAPSNLNVQQHDIFRHIQCRSCCGSVAIRTSNLVTTSPSLVCQPPIPLRIPTSIFVGKNDDAVAEGKNNTIDPEKIILPFVGIIATVIFGICTSLGYTIDDVVTTIQTFFSNPQAVLGSFIENVKDMGPIGALYFGLFYLIAETLAVPATPLALSAGYLFGLTEGFAVVLAAATIAACIGFFVGKTFLRTYVERILVENPKFAKLDRAVGERGFKLLVLIRLSPIFPFSISNYIYGASSIDFPSYFWGTLLGFTPSTFAYVYTGMVGKEVMLGEDGQPWYVYLAGFSVLVTLLKLVTDVATGIIEAIEDENEPSKL
jgi:uncharacterized membrane protein YdjX (TVP38/TMEM64 family)